MPHFDGVAPGCNIHTTRSTGPCANAGGGHCRWRDNCTGLAHNPWNAHHVLPVHSVNAYGAIAQYGSVISQIDTTYKLTSWCINQKGNMIGLALKSTFLNHPGVRSIMLPAHDVDHNCT